MSRGPAALLAAAPSTPSFLLYGGVPCSRFAAVRLAVERPYCGLFDEVGDVATQDAAPPSRMRVRSISGLPLILHVRNAAPPPSLSSSPFARRQPAHGRAKAGATCLRCVALSCPCRVASVRHYMLVAPIRLRGVAAGNGERERDADLLSWDAEGGLLSPPSSALALALSSLSHLRRSRGRGTEDLGATRTHTPSRAPYFDVLRCSVDLSRGGKADPGRKRERLRMQGDAAASEAEEEAAEGTRAQPYSLWLGFDNFLVQEVLNTHRTLVGKIGFV
ncbi:hypothetical protein DFH08DRAFT_808753 [Mycena albidolilacea]|uniref:Uncharacterized protein n=1 Tax=Mycena albidolilacea TaxID=1033008 RepID=A0AAD7A260_9AGAR|nr:hypothetical protein DFH08DRAFT_808753 [Mycena albidolilacea]